MRIWVKPFGNGRRECGYCLRREGVFSNAEFCRQAAEHLVGFDGLWVWRCHAHLTMSNDYGAVLVVEINAPPA